MQINNIQPKLYKIVYWYKKNHNCSTNVTSDLYYKNIFTIVSDASTLNVLLALDLALAGIVNYARKWHRSLEHHSLTTLDLSLTIVICLKQTLFA